MNIDRVFSIGAAIDGNNGEYWKKRIEDTLSGKCCLDGSVNLGDILLSVYASRHPDILGEHDTFIAYGAGRMAGAHLPRLMEKLEFSEIWDAYSRAESLAGLKIRRPEEGRDGAAIIVFIDDYEIRKRAVNMLEGMGYKDVFYYRYCLCATHSLPGLEGLEDRVTDETEKILEEIDSKYSLISSNLPSVLYSALPVSLKEKGSVHFEGLSKKAEELLGLLKEHLILKCDEKEAAESIRCTAGGGWDTAFDAAYNIEMLLRTLLQGGAKTKKRPMKMFRDMPYDPFAVFEMTRLIIGWMHTDDETKLGTAEELADLNKGSLALRAVKAYYLCGAGKYEEALCTVREMLHADSNSLLANEAFFEVAKTCRKNGIEVEEPIPLYDLAEYFCWSGMNFAWCGGYDRERDRAEWSPCFRPLQCSARPDDEFWKGDDWKEFRKSLMDGSFRYCQKTQCPNLVAGWLPRKDKITDETMLKIINGDFDVIPPLEELHFSYDEHCNLCCPSCRTYYKTITTDKANEFDDFYERFLREHVRKAKHLCLSGCGEAMISPHSRKLLQSLSPEDCPNLEVELRTNMTTVTPQAWEALGEGRKVIRHIAASIDSSRKDDFERIRYPAKWDNVCANLKFVQELRNNGDLDVFEFHVVIQKDNVDQLLEIIKMAMSYDVDVVTFSRLINWREMPEEEYNEINPFWINNRYHERLLEEIEKVKAFRESIEDGSCDLIRNGKKIFINMHFEPDPNDRYDEIRYGRFRIR